MSPWDLAAVVLGACTLAGYLTVAGLRDRQLDLKEAIAFFVGGAGLATAGRLLFVTVTASDEELAPFTGEDRISIIIATIALLWVFVDSAQSWYRGE